MAYIQGTSRPPSLTTIQIPTLVEGLCEITSSGTYTRANFGTVQYKGQYQYFNFDQNAERQDSPPYASFSSYYNYTAYNGM